MDIAQLIINSLITSTELAIIAVGLTMTFSILKFANFAHLDAGVLGAYVAYIFNVTLGFPLAVSLALAAFLAGVFGIAIDRSVFRRLRDSGDVTPMIASLGLSIAIRHAVQMIWGPQNVRYDFPIRTAYPLFAAHVTMPQIGIFGVVTVAMTAFHAMLKYTRVGKALRATATNPELAQASRIDTERSIRLVWLIGTAFSAVGAILVAWDTQLDPYLGSNLVIPVFCVVLIGGVGSVYGAVLGALIVGFAQNLGVTLDLAPALNLFGVLNLVERVQLPVAYKPAIVYAAVILLLLLRPSGLARRELV